MLTGRFQTASRPMGSLSTGMASQTIMMKRAYVLMRSPGDNWVDHADDNGPFGCMLVAEYVRLTQDFQYFCDVEPTLMLGLNFVNRSAYGLIYNSPVVCQLIKIDVLCSCFDRRQTARTASPTLLPRPVTPISSLHPCVTCAQARSSSHPCSSTRLRANCRT